jgi:hypothetical protein
LAATGICTGAVGCAGGLGGEAFPPSCSAGIPSKVAVGLISSSSLLFWLLAPYKMLLRGCGVVKGFGGAAKGEDGAGGAGGVCTEVAGAPNGEGGAANGDENGLLSEGGAKGSELDGANGSIIVALKGSDASAGAANGLASWFRGDKAVITAVARVGWGLLTSAIVLSIKACESKGLAM